MPLSVGLDVGSHHVRAVAVRTGRGGPAVAAHVSVPRRDADGAERPLATVIAELAAAVPLRAPAACASSELEVLARFVTVAPLPESRLHRLLRLELAPEEGPAPAMDVVRLAAGGDDLAFLGLIAETGAVKMLLAELARGGVRPKAVSWGPVALAAAAGRLPLEGDQLALVVDIGAAGSDVALVGAGRVVACRRLGIGGELFTQALIESGQTPAQAEQSKISGDFAKAAAPGQPAAAAAPAAGDALFDDGSLQLDLGDEPQIPVSSPGQSTMAMAGLSLGPQLTRSAETMYGQLTTTIAFFKAQLKIQQLAVSRVYLCGGGAGLVALDEYLARRFQVPVERWDPFAGMAGTVPDEPYRWARALGLALAGTADVPHADLRPEAMLRRELWVRRLVWPWVAAACILVAGVAAAMVLSERVDRDTREAELLERAATEHKRLTEELKSLDAEREALSDDLRAIAGRIYAARDLLLTVQALKRLTQEHKELWVTNLETTKDDRELTSEAPPAADGPKRPLLDRGKPAARVDSLISRGAVELVGRVRFEAAKKDPEMLAFLDRYKMALRDCTTADGWPLFRDVRTQRGMPERFKGRQTSGDAGEFLFTFKCYYPPTHLEAAPPGGAGAVEKAP